MRYFWTFFVFSFLFFNNAWGDSHAEPKKGAAGLSAEKALQKLQAGNKRFLAGTFRAEGGRGPSDRKRLASGEAPHTIVLSCSDSRVPPELVFDQGLGELYTVRVSGQALDSSVMASIEYAVKELGASHIFVMGHSGCEAVKAAVGAKKGVTSGSPSLDKLVADIKPRIDRGPAAISGKNVEIEAGLNARQVAEDLASRSVILAEAIREGRLQINSGIYFLESGKVDFY